MREHGGGDALRVDGSFERLCNAACAGRTFARVSEFADVALSKVVM